MTDEHIEHCFQGENKSNCKYGMEEVCTANTWHFKLGQRILSRHIAAMAWALIPASCVWVNWANHGSEAGLYTLYAVVATIFVIGRSNKWRYS